MSANNAEIGLGKIQDDLAVRLIATPRPNIVTCDADEALGNAIEQSRAHDFDFLPVLGQVSEKANIPARIVGLLDISQITLESFELRDTLVRQVMSPLSEENLIGADASIVTFIRDADKHPCRLVVAGPEISGLVCLSDLHRLPVRAALFAMVTHLEMTMADLIRQEFNGSDRWAERLSTSRQKNLADMIDKAKASDEYIYDPLLYTQFCDKITIIKKRPTFEGRRSAFEAELSAIQKLRDYLAHGNEYAPDRVAACVVCERVRLIDKWTEILSLAGN